MTDKQIIEYVKQMIMDNLERGDNVKEMAMLIVDDTNELLLAHIIGLIALFKKAKEIINDKGGEIK